MHERVGLNMVPTSLTVSISGASLYSENNYLTTTLLNQSAYY